VFVLSTNMAALAERGGFGRSLAARSLAGYGKGRLNE
jgi:hypothetical protein